jgi:hypothetical protein
VKLLLESILVFKSNQRLGFLHKEFRSEFIKGEEFNQEGVIKELSLGEKLVQVGLKLRLSLLELLLSLHLCKSSMRELWNQVFDGLISSKVKMKFMELIVPSLDDSSLWTVEL